MKKQYMAGLAVGILLTFGVGGPAHADLVVSGTVEYDGAQRNLIYDTDLGITWLDYTNGLDTWSSQMGWTASLSFTINGLTYDNWRLPSTVDGPYVYGSNGTTTAGYNITTSEMGYLFYTELGNKGYYDTNGNLQAGYGQTNKGPFAYRVAATTWSSTEYANDLGQAWVFSPYWGDQEVQAKSRVQYGVAVISGQIQAASVPEPASMLLIGSGLTGLVGLGRGRRRGH